MSFMVYVVGELCWCKPWPAGQATQLKAAAAAEGGRSRSTEPQKVLQKDKERNVLLEMGNTSASLERWVLARRMLLVPGARLEL